jgi:MoxR-like ATPase
MATRQDTHPDGERDESTERAERDERGESGERDEGAGRDATDVSHAAASRDPKTAHASAAAAASADALGRALARVGYLADARTALVAWLALSLHRPLLVEGPAGVGKTELARALAECLARPLVRLQCYEGLDEAKALYEWDYAKQMLYTQLLRDVVRRGTEGAATVADAMERMSEADVAFYAPRFLIERPLLRAMTSEVPVVLLIDEVDRADPEFEAFLLEVLAEGQVTIPELGTVRAKQPPLVLLTTNATRDMTDALRRRCLHLFVDYPPPSREMQILETRVPGLSRGLAEALAAFAAKVRSLELRKAPSIAETVDWARALLLLAANALEPGIVAETLGVLVKHEDDREKVTARLPDLLKTGKP